MINTALVKLWGTTIGAVSLDDSQRTADFEYDLSFVSKCMACKAGAASRIL